MEAEAGLATSYARLWGALASLFGGGSGPSFHGSLKPRPDDQPWDEYHIHYGPNIAAALGLRDETCDFGACGPIVFNVKPAHWGTGSSCYFVFGNCGLSSYVLQLFVFAHALNGQQQKQPQKPRCNPWTRVAGLVEAADGYTTTSAMVDLAAIHFWAGVSVIAATCFTPEPGEPAACVGGSFAGSSMAVGGLALGSGAYLVGKNEMIPGIMKAITCEP